MPNDATSSPPMKQIDPEVHVPWLSYAKALEMKYRDDPKHQYETGPGPTLSLAIDLAEKGFDRSRTVGGAASPVEDNDDEKKRDHERKEFGTEVIGLRLKFEAALQVGAAHALEQLLTELRKELTAEPTVADVERALCLPTKALPALVADGDPMAEQLDPSKTWVKKVSAAFEVWAKRLGSAFVAKPWRGDAWNHAWSCAAALTEMERWLKFASQVGVPSRWDRVITVMLRPDRPMARYSTANVDTLTCLPTDRDSALTVRLQISPWLALTLDPPKKGESQPIANHDLRMLRQKLRSLGDRSNADKFLSKGLKIGHLYISVFIQRISQSISPSALSPMKPYQITPPAELPSALHDSLDPGEWDIHLMGMGILQTQAKALAAHHARAAGQIVQVEKQVAKSKLRMNLRWAKPMLSPLRPLPAKELEWLPPPITEGDSLGSILLSPQALNKDNPPQYTDCSILVRFRDRWYVIRPELLDVADENGDEDSERVALHAYAPLPPALIEAGGWPRLAQAMPQACWVGHFRGLGMLLLAALDLDSRTL